MGLFQSGNRQFETGRASGLELAELIRAGLIRAGLIGAGLIGLGGCGEAPQSQSTPAQLEYEVRQLPTSTVHILRIPQHYSIRVAMAPQVATVEELAKAQGAIAAINAGFFDGVNQQTTSFVGVNSKLVGDPRKNPRLTQNPALEPYMAAILGRSEFRRYRCDGEGRYAIVYRTAPVPDGCTWVDIVGAGPRLLPELTATQEGFLDPQAKRDPLGHDQLNARSAIALARDGRILWVMAAQKSPVQGSAQSSGLSLPDLADLLRTENVKQALNLDGGGSSGLYYQGNMIYGKSDGANQPVVRGVKSVLLLMPEGSAEPAPAASQKKRSPSPEALAPKP